MADFIDFARTHGAQPSQVFNTLTAFIQGTHSQHIAISTPPQEGKTTFLTLWLAWQLVENPWLNVVYASYNQTRADEISRKIRTHLPPQLLMHGSNSVRRWQTVVGGGLLAAGRGSALTGFSADIIVIDDPVKDLKEALSEKVKESLKDWLQSVVLTRLSADSQTILVSTRWAYDDAHRFYTENLDAPTLNIPAQASQNDPCGRQPGEYLDSVQGRTPTQWDTIKTSVGAKVWASLYQGEPSPSGGAIFPPDALNVVPASLWLTQQGRLKYPALVTQSWDLTFTGNSKADYVAGHTYAYMQGKHVLVDRVHARLTFTQTLAAIQRMYRKWPGTHRICVEKAANGAAVIDTLQRRLPMIYPVTPRGSKEARANAVTAMLPQVDVLDTAVDAYFLKQFEFFPGFEHDDDVDALTQYLNNFKQNYTMLF